MKSFPVAALLVLNVSLINACGTSEETDTRTTALPGTSTAITVASGVTTGTTLADHSKFASTMDADTKAYFAYDMANLAKWNDASRPIAVTALGKALGVMDVNATTVGQWFMDRMTYIFPDDGSDFAFGIVVPADKAVYAASFQGDTSASIAGANMGAAMFDFYLSNHAAGVDGVMIKFDSQYIPFLSPRTGVMQIGPALFGNDDSLDTTRSESHRIVKSIYRLNVLLHESRHSDGNRAAGSFGFSHVNCPSDGSVATELAGLPACDGFANGAYNVSRRVIGGIVGLCDGVCQQGDLSVLESVRIDMASRIIVADTAANNGDATPETALTVVDTSMFRIVP